MSDVIRDGTPSDPSGAEVIGQETITYRASLLVRILLFGLGAGIAVVGVIVGLDPVADGPQRGGGWFIALFGLWLAIRAPRVALHADREGLLVRGWFVSRRFRWDEVRTISPGVSSMPSRGARLPYTLVIERTDHTSFPVDCLAEVTEAGLADRAAALRRLGGLDPVITTAAQPRMRRWATYFALMLLVPLALAIAMNTEPDRYEPPDPDDLDEALDDLFGPAGAGECVAGLPNELPLHRAVDCAPGTIRVLAIIDLDDSVPDPGEAELERQADTLCPLESDRWLLPTERTWGPDGDDIYCLEDV